VPGRLLRRRHRDGRPDRRAALAADLHPRDEPADPYLTRVLAAAEDTLALHLDDTGYDPAVDDPGEALTGWTDQPDRTVTDVLALIDRAIRTLATTAS